jgi:catecholate siderophore receptor
MGVRNDEFRTSYIDQTAVLPANRYLSREDSMLSYRFGLVFHPTKNSSIYAAYGVSYNPAAELGTLSSAGNNAANVALPPEKNVVREVGAKVDLIPNQLTLTGAFFKIEKTNLRIPTDPNSSTGPLVLEGLALSQGVEFGLVGKITDKWQITTGYAYTDTEIARTRNLAELGNRLPNAPLNSYTLWTTYDLTSQWTVGGGATWQSEAFVNTTNMAEVPGYWKFDAMTSYKIDKNWTLQFNIYNITNAFYFAQYYQGQAVPGPSRYASLSLRVHW